MRLCAMRGGVLRDEPKVKRDVPERVLGLAGNDDAVPVGGRRLPVSVGGVFRRAEMLSRLRSVKWFGVLRLGTTLVVAGAGGLERRVVTSGVAGVGDGLRDGAARVTEGARAGAGRMTVAVFGTSGARRGTGRVAGAVSGSRLGAARRMADGELAIRLGTTLVVAGTGWLKRGVAVWTGDGVRDGAAGIIDGARAGAERVTDGALDMRLGTERMTGAGVDMRLGATLVVAGAGGLERGTAAGAGDGLRDGAARVIDGARTGAAGAGLGARLGAERVTGAEEWLSPDAERMEDRDGLAEPLRENEEDDVRRASALYETANVSVMIAIAKSLLFFILAPFRANALYIPRSLLFGVELVKRTYEFLAGYVPAQCVKRSIKLAIAQKNKKLNFCLTMAGAIE
jgi:hypothetical protein